MFFLPYFKKDDLGINKNYKVITFTAIPAKVNINLLLNRIQPKVEKFLRKNQERPQLHRFNSFVEPLKDYAQRQHHC